MKDDPPTCPGCGASLDDKAARQVGGVERLGCLGCGLQLVRRPGQGWESIRG
ncbi:MAG: hypothetical protein JO050_09905 [Acidimicrobiia bacterium]|nr:hypothetical protein [Acidimicrobiia bacterium]